MKKYLFGIFAVTIAIGFSAFSVRVNETFYYKGSSFADSDFQTVSNWVTNSSLGTIDCAEVELFTCSMDLQNGNDTNNDGILDAGATITVSSGDIQDVERSSQSVFVSDDLGDIK